MLVDYVPNAQAVEEKKAFGTSKKTIAAGSEVRPQAMQQLPVRAGVRERVGSTRIGTARIFDSEIRPMIVETPTACHYIGRSAGSDRSPAVIACGA